MRPLLNRQAWLICLAFVATRCAFAGLLQDPGFDQPEYQSPWVFSSGAYTRPAGGNYPTPYAGTRDLKLEVNAGMLGETAFAKQSLPAFGQQEWTFSGHMLNYDVIGVMMKPGSYGLLEIVFTGAAFGEQRFSSPRYTPEVQWSATPDKWSFGTVSGVAPAGTEQVTFFVKIVQGEVLDAGWGSIWWDEMNATVLDPVPELASTGWVAVLMIGMAIGGQRLVNRRTARSKDPKSL